MKKLYGVYGSSGFGREVFPVLKAQLENEFNGEEDYDIAYIDDAADNTPIRGIPVYRFEEFIGLPAQDKQVSIAIADPAIREKLTGKCAAKGIPQFSIKAANVVSLDNVNIGEGSILCPFVTLTSDISIGKGFHANIYSYVAHDCIIGDYVTFCPRVNCNGNIHIEDYAYIGTGAVFKQGKPNRPLKVGKGAVVAAGAVVTKNVPPGTTVFGNPAVPMTRANLEARRDRG